MRFGRGLRKVCGCRERGLLSVRVKGLWGRSHGPPLFSVQSQSRITFRCASACEQEQSERTSKAEKAVPCRVVPVLAMFSPSRLERREREQVSESSVGHAPGEKPASLDSSSHRHLCARVGLLTNSQVVWRRVFEMLRQSSCSEAREFQHQVQEDPQSSSHTMHYSLQRFLDGG